MRKQFVKTLKSLLNDDNNTVLLLCDIGVYGFREELISYPDRVYNIGILEQSTVSLSSGLSISGLIPFIHTISPFLVERALEQLKIDFGYQNLNGNFITVGSSYDYSSLGPTHHCSGDVSQLLTIPNMEIILPGTSEEFNQLLIQGYNNGNPTYYRISEYENKKSQTVTLGKANLIKKGNIATIICVGNILQNVIDATEDIDVTILYYTTIKPFDSDILLKNFNENIIIIEPYYEGGINYMVNKSLEGKKYKITNIGVPHVFLKNYGKKSDHDENFKLNAEGIKNQIISCL